jgi:hypothetical protein
MLSRGYVVWHGDCWQVDGDQCGCPPTSTINLWYPVRTIIEVKIDGVVIDPSTYTVIRERKLARLDGAWPACQNVNLADSEDGTFSVVYTWGRYPPEAGKLAAAQLAWLLKVQRRGLRSAQGHPRVTRQGIAIEGALTTCTTRAGRQGCRWSTPSSPPSTPRA